MTSEESIISITNMHKYYPRVLALDGLTLDIKPGVFGLIGPNGSGKSTLIHVLLGLIRSDAGKGTIFGLDIKKDSLKIRRRVGVLHEKPAFPKKMEVLEYLSKVSKLYKKNMSAENALSMVELFYAKDKQIDALSAGMHQRLGIAQALIGNPELVILDEPTSNLDISGRDMIINLIVKLHNEHGMSFLVSSHILSELERACHQVAFIRGGKIVEQGSVLDLIERLTSHVCRIVVSDAKALSPMLADITGLYDPRITGASSITFVIDDVPLENVKSEIEQKATELGVRIYSLEQGGTLEDVYRGLML
ncbi:MAG: ABC transporter ATP-binding protein [Candidatus Thorarchaeota archaeon]